MQSVTSVLHTSKCHFTSDGRLEVYAARLATKLNKFFKKYDNGDYVFSEGEEGVYDVSPDRIQLILSTFLTRKRAEAV